MARVLKAKYFKHVDLMEAKLRSNPSFMWRSILWDRQILKKGLRWRISTGNRVYIYKSNWLRRPETFKPFSPQTIDQYVMVSDLIDEEQNLKEREIKQHFMEEDADSILKIPLPRTPQPDQYIGYQLAMKLKFPDKPSISDTSQSHWGVIWAVEILEKVKVFMCKAARNLLPTAENLEKRKVLPNPFCHRCGLKSEDAFHALMECKAAQNVWKNTVFTEEVKVLNHQDMLSVLHEMGRKRSKKELKLIAALCWAIWHSRNLLIFEWKKEDSQLSAARAEAMLESYRRIKIPDTQKYKNQQVKRQQTWSPPPEGWFKVNVIKDQVAGLGVVVDLIQNKVARQKFSGLCHQFKTI
ncbi:putative reverse transcriptase/RNA-dependent DNA polymerase [Citrus sinensis]|uniref:Reverse transcriptase/RNA-dependent DNA polymerase n=1 Tax=Citrus sinensis TaxID=2711 RepID=A0ACB8NWX7_CITSI|nr:putative reverse transcriptase/RNA-dependent DNA polymerase [Citrus sinensis]